MASLCGRWCLTIHIVPTHRIELFFVAFSLAHRSRCFPVDDTATPTWSTTPSFLALAPLKTIGRRLPQYVAMSPPPSDDSAAAPPSLPMSSGGGVTAFLSVVVSSSDMVSRAGGSSRLNYELGSSRTSWQRVKEMESLGYFPTGYDRAAGTETLLRPDGEVLVLLTCLVLEFLP
jgi:hypothetical protein